MVSRALQSRLGLRWIVIGVLCLGVFPSLTAFSERVYAFWPDLARVLGPINPLKLGLPFLMAHLFFHWKILGRRLLLVLGVVLLLGSISTLYAATRCGGEPSIFREWAVFVIGLLAGCVLFTIRPGDAAGVSGSWLLALIGSAILQVVSPASVNWIIDHFFDPRQEAIGPLMGVWDQGSLAKMLSIGFWVFALSLVRLGWSGRSTTLLFAAGAASFFIILGTLQRGPLLGIGLGAVAVCLHIGYRSKNWKPALFTALGGILVLVIAIQIFPSGTIQSRLKSFLWMRPQSALETSAAYTRDERLRLARLSWDTIRSYPLGNACIPPETFKQYQLVDTYHAHNIILQQYRAKGWIWGTAHLLLWLLALLGTWRSKSSSGGVALGGLVAVLGLGMADHPWWVLNQSMMIGAILVFGLGTYFGDSELDVTQRSNQA